MNKEQIEQMAQKYAEENVWYPGEISYESDIMAMKESFADAFKAGAEWQANQSPWISVNDAVPNKNANGMCEVKYADGSIGYMVMRHVYRWVYPYTDKECVTHWRPIEQ